MDYKTKPISRKDLISTLKIMEKNLGQSPNKTMPLRQCTLLMKLIDSIIKVLLTVKKPRINMIQEMVG